MLNLIVREARRALRGCAKLLARFDPKPYIMYGRATATPLSKSYGCAVECRDRLINRNTQQCFEHFVRTSHRSRLPESARFA